MAERWQDEAWAQAFWWSGKTTRRSFLGLGAALLGLGYAYRRFGFDQAPQGTK